MRAWACLVWDNDIRFRGKIICRVFAEDWLVVVCNYIFKKQVRMAGLLVFRKTYLEKIKFDPQKIPFLLINTISQGWKVSSIEKRV